MANNPYVKRPGTGTGGQGHAQTASASGPAQTTQNTQTRYIPPKKEKKYRFLNVVIIMMTIVIFCMVVGLIVSTSPRTENFYDKNSAEDLIRKMNFSGYQRIVEGKYENEVLGITVENTPSMVIPYAIADYYEAGFCYRGYAGANDPGAQAYKDAMDEAKASMGEYEYIADEIDEFLKIK